MEPESDKVLEKQLRELKEELTVVRSGGAEFASMLGKLRPEDSDLQQQDSVLSSKIQKLEAKRQNQIQCVSKVQVIGVVADFEEAPDPPDTTASRTISSDDSEEAEEAGPQKSSSHILWIPKRFTCVDEKFAAGTWILGLVNLFVMIVLVVLFGLSVGGAEEWSNAESQIQLIGFFAASVGSFLVLPVLFVCIAQREALADEDECENPHEWTNPKTNAFPIRGCLCIFYLACFCSVGFSIPAFNLLQ